MWNWIKQLVLRGGCSFLWSSCGPGCFLQTEVAGGYLVYPEGNHWRIRFYSYYVSDWCKPEPRIFSSEREAKAEVESQYRVFGSIVL